MCQMLSEMTCDVGICCSHLYFWSDRDQYEFIVAVAKEEEVHMR